MVEWVRCWKLLAWVWMFGIYPVQQASACSTGEVSQLFGYEMRTQTVLDIEAAMARAQAKHGYIPRGAAEAISKRARVELVPEDEFDAEYAKVRHRMVALLNVWRRNLPPEAQQFVHYGATTVDIYGTASMLQIDVSIEMIDNCLNAAIDEMSRLASQHVHTVMIGRTLGQHAQPISFGKKVSTWMGEYSRHRIRLAELRSRVRRSAVLKGAVGNYSGLGPRAIEIEKSFAEELGFDAPYAADWHGTRDVIAEYGIVLGLIARSHARIGQEIFLLQSTDIGEVQEKLRSGVVGSSSMPHKRNPIIPERLIHAGRTIPRLGEVLADDVVNYYERDNTSRLSPILGDISVQSVTAAKSLGALLKGLEINVQRMRENIDRTSGYAMSQEIAFALAAYIPRTEAEAHVKAIIRKSAADGSSFESALNNDPKVRAHLSPETISLLLDPEKLNSTAAAQITAAIEEAMGKSAERD